MPNSPYYSFMENFRDQEELSLTKILTFGIFLSAGDPMKKATYLYRTCDPEFSGAVQRQAFGVVYDTMQVICTSGLEKLCAFGQSDQLAKDKLSTYVSTL